MILGLFRRQLQGARDSELDQPHALFGHGWCTAGPLNSSMLGS